MNKTIKLLLSTITTFTSAIAGSFIVMQATSNYKNNISLSVENKSSTPIFNDTRVEATEGSNGTTGQTNNRPGIGEKEETTASFSFVSENEAKEIYPEYGTKKANEIGAETIKKLVKPSIPTVDYIIDMIPTTDEDRRNGGVSFYVIQMKKKYVNGTISELKKEYIVNPTKKPSTIQNGDVTDNSSPTEEHKWTTYQIQEGSSQNSTTEETNKYLPGIAITEKYNFAWNDPYKIKSFIDSYSGSLNDIKDEEILTNFVKQGDSYLLPKKSDFSIIKKTDETKGVLEIEFNFNKTAIKSYLYEQNNDWVGGNLPSNTKRIFRGFNKKNILLKTENISSFEVDKQIANNPLNEFLLSDENTLNYIHPSEFASLSKNDLIDLFTRNKYLMKGNNSPIAYLSYNDIQLSKYNESLKVNKNITSIQMENLKLPESWIIGSSITDIKITPDDINGKMDVTFTYTTYDVASEELLKDQIKTITFTGLKKNNDLEPSILNLKDQHGISDFSSVQDLMETYKSIKDDKEALRTFSNLFIDSASTNVLQKDREVILNNNTKNNSEEVNLTLKFSSWNGQSYKEGDQTIEGAKFEQKFIIKDNSKYFSGITWNSNSDVKNQIIQLIGNANRDSNAINLTPSEVIDLIYEKDAKNIFVNGLSQQNSIAFFSDNLNGNIIVKIQSKIDNNSEYAIQTRIFSGFKKENTSIEHFSWLSDEDIENTLLKKDINSIGGQDIIDDYLNKIPYFAGMNLNANDITISNVNKETGQLTFEVKVPFGSGISDEPQVFKTTIKGFAVGTIEDMNSYVAPQDLTLILSITLASIAVVSLGTYFGITISKRIKTNKVKNKF